MSLATYCLLYPAPEATIRKFRRDKMNSRLSVRSMRSLCDGPVVCLTAQDSAGLHWDFEPTFSRSQQHAYKYSDPRFFEKPSTLEGLKSLTGEVSLSR
jgi:hypothetical protein